MRRPSPPEPDMHSLTACRVGTHPVPAHLCVFGDQSSEERELYFYVWIVRSGDSIGLVDSGLPFGDDLTALRTTGIYRDVVQLDDLLDRNGVAADDIDWCAVTQSVTYHSGGLLADYLPRADVYIAAAGVREMLQSPPGHPPVNMYFTEASWTFLRHLAIEGRLHLVDHEVQIAPGVVFEPTGGASPWIGRRAHFDRPRNRRNLRDCVPAGEHRPRHPDRDGREHEPARKRGVRGG